MLWLGIARQLGLGFARKLGGDSLASSEKKCF